MRTGVTSRQNIANSLISVTTATWISTLVMASADVEDEEGVYGVVALA